MKKRLVSLLTVAAMGIALAACGNAEQAVKDEAAKVEEAVEEAVEEVAEELGLGEVAELHAVVAQYGNNTQAWWADFEKAFNEEYKDSISLSVDVVSWNDIYTNVSTLIKNGQAPDILNIDVFADYQADDLLLPIQDVISDETYAKFYDSFLEQSVVDDVVWAVPDLASARALYYNPDILKAAGVEVPTTWDELVDVCEAIKAYDSNIYPWGIDMTTDEGQAAFAYYTWNNGGGFYEDGEWILNCPENVEAIEFAIDLVKNGYTNTDPANETRYDLQDMFGAGKIAMVIAPNSLPTYLKDGGYDVNLEVAAIPTNTGESVSAGVMDRFMVFDNDYSAAQMLALETFFDYFYDDDRYSDWVLMEGFLPATEAGGEAVAAADPSQAPWVEIVGSSKFYPVAEAAWADVKQGVIEVEQNALLGGDVQALLDDLQDFIAD